MINEASTFIKCELKTKFEGQDNIEGSANETAAINEVEKISENTIKYDRGASSRDNRQDSKSSS